jgi:hypothetical protein
LVVSPVRLPPLYLARFGKFALRVLVSSCLGADLAAADLVRTPTAILVAAKVRNEVELRAVLSIRTILTQSLALERNLELLAVSAGWI